MTTQPTMTDILLTSKQAQEDTYIACIEAGLVPGTISISGPDTVEKLKAIEEIELCFFRVPRKYVVNRMSGLLVAQVLQKLPENTQGRVVLSFDGWADDPRELFEIPEAILFCQGLLFGPDAAHMNMGQARSMMSILLNEADRAEKEPEAYELSGALFVLCVAFVNIFCAKTGNDWGRNLDLAKELRFKLLNPTAPIGHD